MSQKTIILSVLILFALCVGVVVYVQIDTTTSTPQADALTESSVDVPEPPHPGVSTTALYRLPLADSAPPDRVHHTIPLEEIRRGCFRQDCIPSVDSPRFVEARSLTEELDPQSLGIYVAEAERFYPFPMLETREIVNDTFPDGTPVAVTYCPLCGTGIVFSRELADGTVSEFGVSGMLWQSNLLMYNRAENLRDRNLWSQVLGQAVVGDRAGEVLQVVPSDVIAFGDFLTFSPTGQTLTTGTPRDPYDGEYYRTAASFNPNFDVQTSSLAPMTRVHGIIVNGQPKAYVSADVIEGMTDIVAGERIFVEKSDAGVRFLMSNAELGEAPTQLPDIEGFWFSWKAAHPETELWVAN